MISKKKMFIFMTIALAIIFSGTYYLSDRYFKGINNQKSKSESVITQNNSDSLDDDIKISLYDGDNKEEMTLGEVKDKFNIASDVNCSNLSMMLKEKGYILSSAGTKELVYKKDSEKGAKPNKYYIGEKDGFLAIYKSDENGTLSIENDDDVYRDNKKVDDLKDGDKTKIRNLQLEYDTKEDAEEDLSEFLS